MGKRKKNIHNSVFINRPIQNEDEDWIGISTYVEKLDAAVEEKAKIVAVTSDFGTGKSSLISLYKNKVKSPIRNIFGFGKKVLSINMWGTYAHINIKDDSGTINEIMPIELHKAFIYQLVCQLSPKDRRKSNYISRRLSKDFGIWAVNGKNRVWSFMAVIALIGLFMCGLLSNFQDYIKPLLKMSDTHFAMAIIGIFLLAVACLGLAITNSEIVFSSKKSEGNRTLDENVLIDLFKQEVLNHGGRQQYIVVLEDLDRIEDKDSALQFLRELRKYYLTDGGRHKITFVVCIKPEAMLQKSSNRDIQEYKKIFDYTINLQKVNVDNYDSILRGLLDEKKEWLEQLRIPVNVATPGMDWMILGRDIDIREIKNRLNETLTLYESLLSRFPMRANKQVITFEKCAVATYLRREYEEDFYKLKDDTLDLFVSQYGIRGMEEIGEEEQICIGKQLSEVFTSEVKRLVKSKLIDANYQVYFYNYPSESRLFTLSEMRVYNSIVYQETPKDKEEYSEYLQHTSEDIIKEAYKKINSLGVRMPLFVLDYDVLFVLLCTEAQEKLFEMILTMRFDENNEKRVCDIIEKCVKQRPGKYDRDGMIHALSNQLCEVVEDRTVLYAIRQRLCQVIPENVGLYRCFFLGDNAFLSVQEVEALNGLEKIMSVINYDSLERETESAYEIHQRILARDRWSPALIEFYQHVIECQGIDQWLDALTAVCCHFKSMPFDIVNIYNEQIVAGHIKVADYVACLENVSTIERYHLQLLQDNLWVEGLSERLCNLLYEAEFYLEYLCNVLLCEDVSINYHDSNLAETIQFNGQWIQSHASVAFDKIRIDVLSDHATIEQYTFLFQNPYPIINQTEVQKVDEVADVLMLIQDRTLTEEQAEYVIDNFNQRYRQPTVAYEIMQFIVAQTTQIAKAMFYNLNLTNVPYKRMARARRKEMNEKLYELFKMENNPEEKVEFLNFTQISVEKIEKDLWKELNKDEKLRGVYVDYVNKLDEISLYTLGNIINLTSVHAYSDTVIGKLWEYGYYKQYVSSKTLKEKMFTVEYDKLKKLWDIYVEMFHASVGWNQTRGYMLDNGEFMQRMVNQKEYMNAKDNCIELYAHAMQSVHLLNYIVSNCNERLQISYFSKIVGFDSEDAAHRFCEIAKKNKIIGQNVEVYHNVKGKLINPGLEGWLTRIMRGKY